MCLRRSLIVVKLLTLFTLPEMKMSTYQNAQVCSEIQLVSLLKQPSTDFPVSV